jgi:hypothetical protein
MAPATTIYLTAKQRKALLSRGRKRRMSFSDQVREAIDIYLDFLPDFEDQGLATPAKEADASLDRSIARLDDAVAHSKRVMERIEELERR